VDLKKNKGDLTIKNKDLTIKKEDVMGLSENLGQIPWV
jgi:hypothetical protein